MVDEDLAQRLLAAHEELMAADDDVAQAVARKNAATSDLNEVQREIRQRRLIRG